MLASHNNILFFLPSFVPFCRSAPHPTTENMSSNCTFFKPCITPDLSDLQSHNPLISMPTHITYENVTNTTTKPNIHYPSTTQQASPTPLGSPPAATSNEPVLQPTHPIPSHPISPPTPLQTTYHPPQISPRLASPRFASPTARVSPDSFRTPNPRTTFYPVSVRYVRAAQHHTSPRLHSRSSSVCHRPCRIVSRTTRQGMEFKEASTQGREGGRWSVSLFPVCVVSGDRGEERAKAKAKGLGGSLHVGTG